MSKMHENELDIDEHLVKKLLADQFPEWAHLPVKRISSSGTDNAIFKFGDDTLIRVPRRADMLDTLQRQEKWVNPMAVHLPLAVPTLIAYGNPQDSFPWHWGIYSWIEGDNLYNNSTLDLNQAALDLAKFINKLQAFDSTNAPRSWRGVTLKSRDAEVRKAIDALKDEIDVQKITDVWNRCISVAEWDKDSVWIHADLLPTNILAQNGKLAGIIDFDGFGVGDPAVDLLPAWSIFTAESRDIFRKQLCVDDATWMRGCGWALSLAIIAIPYYRNTNSVLVAIAHKIIQELLSDVILK